MRIQAFALISATVLVSSVGIFSPASAEARYCLQGSDWGYPGNCQFSTYEQCMASASGTYSYCGINPRYAFARQYHRGYRRGY